jgi:hypothetical protein
MHTFVPPKTNYYGPTLVEQAMQALLLPLANSPWQEIDVSVREKAIVVASKFRCLKEILSNGLGVRVVLPVEVNPHL